MDYDVVIIGGGPGGYVAAIRAAKLGLKVAVVEKSDLGGVCCNWGCIPTKALLHNAYIFDLVKNSKKFGIDIPSYKLDWKKVIKRSRDVAKRLNKGIEYLLNKNKVVYLSNYGKLKDGNTILLDDNKEIKSKFIIIATGGHSKTIPNINIDGKYIISSKEAMNLSQIPKELVIVGAGAIGVEFASIYSSFGSKVTLIEGLNRILPVEDKDVSIELEKIFKRKKINILTNAKVKEIKTGKKTQVILQDKTIVKADKVLMAIGVNPNIKNIGLKKMGIELKNGFINVNEFMQTNIDNIYAIGDVSGPPLLAHVASFEGTLAAEHIFGKKVNPMKYNNVPSCTYTNPEVASVGLTEEQAVSKGYDIKLGKFPFSALGKTLAEGDRDGFVKIIYDSKYGELLGCHIIGKNATNLISEISISRNLETTYSELLNTIHPHPTLSEAIHEATADALNEAIHI